MHHSSVGKIIDVYRRLLSPFGLRGIKKLLNQGLPERFSEPLHFIFGVKLSPEDQKIVDKVEGIRKTVANSGSHFKPVSSGWDITRTSTETAFISSVTQEWGIFLYLCSKTFRAQTILELGSSAGISGAYLASAPTCKNLTTIDGSKELAELAKQNISQVTPNVRVVHGLFNDVLEATLSEISGKIDLVYIDGPKEYESTIRYFKMLLPKLNPNSLVIFDDIMWSQEMWRMWQAVCEIPGFSHSINVGRFGLGLWEGGKVKPVTFDFSKLLGWFRIGRGY